MCDHPVFCWANWIFPEKRSLPRHPGFYRLPSSKAYALELWKARRFYDQLQAGDDDILAPDPAAIPTVPIVGRDRKSLYMNESTRDFRGQFEDGSPAEIDGDEVSNRLLSNVMAQVDSMITYYLRKQLVGFDYIRAAREMERSRKRKECSNGCFSGFRRSNWWSSSDLESHLHRN